MTDAQASEAARALAQVRWGTRRLDKAVDLVIERSADLGDGQRAALGAAIERDGDAE